MRRSCSATCIGISSGCLKCDNATRNIRREAKRLEAFEKSPEEVQRREGILSKLRKEGYCNIVCSVCGQVYMTKEKPLGPFVCEWCPITVVGQKGEVETIPKSTYKLTCNNTYWKIKE